MIELLSLRFGGILRLAPEFMKLEDKKRDREHERAMVGLQLEADKARSAIELQKIEVQATNTLNTAEIGAIIEATKAQATQLQKTGNKFMDFLLTAAEILSATVRPVLTYWYCVVAYGAYKVASYVIILNSGAEWQDAVFQLWTSADHSIMVSIIGFWFVDRAIRGLRKE